MNKKLVLFLNNARRLISDKKPLGQTHLKVCNIWGLNIEIFKVFSLKTAYAHLFIKTVLLKNIFIYLCLYIFQFIYKSNKQIVWCQSLFFTHLSQSLRLNKKYIKELLFISDYGKGVWVSPFRRKWLDLGLFNLRKKLASKLLKILKRQSKKFLKILKLYKLKKRFFNLSKLKKISSISILNNKVLKTFVNKLLIKRLFVHKLCTRFLLRKYINIRYFDKIYNKLYRLILKVRKASRFSMKSLKKKLALYKKNSSHKKFKKVHSRPQLVQFKLKKIKLFLIRFFKFFKEHPKKLSRKRLLQINHQIKQVFLIKYTIIILLKKLTALRRAKFFSKYKNYKLAIKIRTSFKKLSKLYHLLKLTYKSLKKSPSMIVKDGNPFFRFFKSKTGFYIKSNSKKLYVRFFRNKKIYMPSLVESVIVKKGVRYFQFLRTSRNVYIFFKKSIFRVEFNDYQADLQSQIIARRLTNIKRWFKIKEYWDDKLKGPWYKPRAKYADFDAATNPFIEKQVYPLIFDFTLYYYYEQMGASIDAKEREKIYEWANRTRIPVRKIRNRLRWVFPKHWLLWNDSYRIYQQLIEKQSCVDFIWLAPFVFD